MESDADVQKTLESVVLYRVDCEKGEGKDLAKEYKIRAYPTFEVVDTKGAPVDRWLGYDKPFFISTMATALADPATVDIKLARYAAKPDAGTAASLGRYNAGLMQFKDAADYYTRAQELRPDSTTDYTYAIFDNISEGVGAKVFTFDDARTAANQFMASKARTGEQTYTVFMRMIDLAKRNDRIDDLTRYLEAGLNLTTASDDPEMKKSHDILMIDYALYIKKDSASAVEYKKASMPDDWTKNASNLNEFAWWCFENKLNLNEAEKLGRNALGLAKPGKEKANIYDTIAEIVNLKGNAREAADLSKKAVAEDPSSKYFPTQVTKFEELANTKSK